jgi:hypothetical protein
VFEQITTSHIYLTICLVERLQATSIFPNQAFNSGCKSTNIISLLPIHTSTAENTSTNPPYHHSLYPIPKMPTRNLHYPSHTLLTLVPFLTSSLLLGRGNFAGFSSLIYFFSCLRNTLLNLSGGSAVLGIFRQKIGRRHIVWCSSANCVKY